MDTERNPFKNITAGAPFDGLRVVSQVEPQRAQRINFLFVGRRRQTKTFLKLKPKVLPNRRLPIGQKGFPQRTLPFDKLRVPSPVEGRLCGEPSESLSARIGENLRLKILCTLRLGAKNLAKIVLQTFYRQEFNGG